MSMQSERSLIAAISKLLDSFDLAQWIASRCRRLAEEPFAWDLSGQDVLRQDRAPSHTETLPHPFRRRSQSV